MTKSVFTDITDCGKTTCGHVIAIHATSGIKVLPALLKVYTIPISVQHIIKTTKFLVTVCNLRL